MIKMNERTMIPISKSTREYIKKFKRYRRETYDEVISRVFEFFELSRGLPSGEKEEDADMKVTK